MRGWWVWVIWLLKQQEECLTIHRLQDISPAGSQVWEDHLVVYQWDRPNEVLRRSQWSPAGLEPGRACQPTSLNRAEFLHTRVIATGVETFEVSQTIPLKLKLALHRADNRLALERSLFLRNSAR